MSRRSPKFPFSEAQVEKATAPRALPVYDTEDFQVREALIAVGKASINSCRAGGRKPRDQTVRREIRRMLIKGLYPDLPAHLKKSPTGAATLHRICEILAERYGWHAAYDTVRKDVTKIGSRTLRRYRFVASN
jgi:hypothetical protein